MAEWGSAEWKREQNEKLRKAQEKLQADLRSKQAAEQKKNENKARENPPGSRRMRGKDKATKKELQAQKNKKKK